MWRIFLAIDCNSLHALWLSQIKIFAFLFTSVSRPYRFRGSSCSARNRPLHVHTSRSTPTCDRKPKLVVPCGGEKNTGLALAGPAMPVRGNGLRVLFSNIHCASHFLWHGIRIIILSIRRIRIIYINSEYSKNPEEFERSFCVVRKFIWK